MTAAAFIYDDVSLYMGGVDFATATKKFGMTASLEKRDVTTFRQFVSNGVTAPNDAKLLVGGLESSEITISGIADLRDDDVTGVGISSILHAATIARVPIPLTACPDGRSAGSIAYITEQLVASVTDSLEPGIEYVFDSALSGGRVSRGAVLLAPGAVTGSGVGSTVDSAALGVASLDPDGGQYLYVGIHLLSTTGQGIAFGVESSADGFATAGNVRATSATLTAAGGAYLMVPISGHLTDTDFRVTYTVTGGTHVAAVSAAIE